MAGLLERYEFMHCLVSLRLEWEILGTIKMALHYYKVLYCGIVLHMIDIVTGPATHRKASCEPLTTLACPLSPALPSLVVSIRRSSLTLFHII